MKLLSIASLAVLLAFVVARPQNGSDTGTSTSQTGDASGDQAGDGTGDQTGDGTGDQTGADGAWVFSRNRVKKVKKAEEG
ncbi:hypothetical protein C8J56DRAFT_1060762 [Mycena floridula]|nr:hypothetical protein C8J56DRAFT_1060762 [Mycena floridula]